MTHEKGSILNGRNGKCDAPQCFEDILTEETYNAHVLDIYS